MLPLNNYRVDKAPPLIHYIPNFITAEEEKILWNHVYNAPKPKWTQLSNRRLQNWGDVIFTEFLVTGGIPHQKGMVPENLPVWLQIYCDKIADLGAFQDKKPNHVLVNEYSPGQGIMPHEDGPLFYPTVSTITLGSHTLLNFYYHLREMEAAGSKGEEAGEAGVVASWPERHFLSLLLEPRSLVLVQEDMYKIHLHGIQEATEDHITDKVANLHLCNAKLGDTLQRDTRVSLTIRHVPKVFKAKLLFGKR